MLLLGQPKWLYQALEVSALPHIQIIKVQVIFRESKGNNSNFKSVYYHHTPAALSNVCLYQILLLIWKEQIDHCLAQRLVCLQPDLLWNLEVPSLGCLFSPLLMEE